MFIHEGRLHVFYESLSTLLYQYSIIIFSDWYEYDEYLQ